jgi:hypothetical protein
MSGGQSLEGVSAGSFSFNADDGLASESYDANRKTGDKENRGQTGRSPSLEE